VASCVVSILLGGLTLSFPFRLTVLLHELAIAVPNDRYGYHHAGDHGAHDPQDLGLAFRSI
jgi:hypothetical protein